jgi:hypothetical protein
MEKAATVESSANVHDTKILEDKIQKLNLLIKEKKFRNQKTEKEDKELESLQKSLLNSIYYVKYRSEIFQQRGIGVEIKGVVNKRIDESEKQVKDMTAFIIRIIQFCFPSRLTLEMEKDKTYVLNEYKLIEKDVRKKIEDAVLSKKVKEGMMMFEDKLNKGEESETNK